MVISAFAALKYFNKLNVIGQFLTIDNNQRLKTTGVIKDMPQQSHFNADFFESMSSLPDSRSNAWLPMNYRTYILFRKGADPKQMEAQFPQLLKKYCSAKLRKAPG